MIGTNVSQPESLIESKCPLELFNICTDINRQNQQVPVFYGMWCRSRCFVHVSRHFQCGTQASSTNVVTA
jgi:hypothetical protein